MRNETRFVVPVGGLLVRDSVTMTPLPTGGAVVPWNTFWRRRLIDGAIVVKKVEEEAEEKPSSYTAPRRNEKGGK